MTVQPGPGGPTAPPDQRLSQDAPFREPVEAWIEAGADCWWQIAVDGVPPVGHRDRKKVYNRLHVAWKREMERHNLATGRDGDFSARLVRAGGQDFWAWGPKGMEGS